MPTCTETSGPAIAPAKPASTAPAAKIAVFRSVMSVPSAATISRFVEPARISMPIRVFAMTNQSPTAIAMPEAMMTSR